MIKTNTLLKYPGGKTKELPIIHQYLPKNFNNYYEAFVGGGSVFFSINANNYFINDKAEELINLYQMIKEKNEKFFRYIYRINKDWKLLDDVCEKHFIELKCYYNQFIVGDLSKDVLKTLITVFVKNNKDEFNGMLSNDFNINIPYFITEISKSIANKFTRMKKNGISPNIDLDMKLNFVCAFKTAFYNHFRYLYNNQKKYDINTEFYTAIYLFVREYCYASMYRYNKLGEFNVPYGGISYNDKELTNKIENYTDKTILSKLENSKIYNLDFEDFFDKNIMTGKDFLFLDPPYDTEFSTYSKNSFGKKEQERLANYLIKICKAQFMLVIKNTEFISNLYIKDSKTANGKKLKIIPFEKSYLVNFKNRNNKDVTHLLITNY